MSAPQALLEFFQQEAVEYLDRLEQMLVASEHACPDPSAFLTHARALRGSATMTRLDGLPDLAATVERIATGLRDNELRWDQRLHFAVHGALVELRDLVAHANNWGETEHRRSRTQSVALAAVAAGYLAHALGPASLGSPVVPISRFFPDDGTPGVIERNPNPPFTLAQRFRSDVAAAADGIARETVQLVNSQAGPAQLALTDGLRRALLGLSDVAESYGATSIAALAVTMARSPLDATAERTAIQSYAQLLMDRELSDQELAGRVKNATLLWPGRRTPSASQTPNAASTASISGRTQQVTSPSAGSAPVPGTPIAPSVAIPTPARASTPAPPRLVIRDLPATPSPTPRPSPIATPVVPIESLLYSGSSALTRAREVRDLLRTSWLEKGGSSIDPAAAALLDELSDLLDLAVAP